MASGAWLFMACLTIKITRRETCFHTAEIHVKPFVLNALHSRNDPFPLVPKVESGKIRTMLELSGLLRDRTINEIRH